MKMKDYKGPWIKTKHTVKSIDDVKSIDEEVYFPLFGKWVTWECEKCKSLECQAGFEKKPRPRQQYCWTCTKKWAESKHK